MLRVTHGTTQQAWAYQKPTLTKQMDTAALSSQAPHHLNKISRRHLKSQRINKTRRNLVTTTEK